MLSHAHHCCRFLTVPAFLKIFTGGCEISPCVPFAKNTSRWANHTIRRNARDRTLRTNSHAHARAHARTLTQSHACTRTHTHARPHARTHALSATHARTQAHSHALRLARTHACMHAPMHMQTYAHAHLRDRRCASVRARTQRLSLTFVCIILVCRLIHRWRLTTQFDHVFDHFIEPDCGTSNDARSALRDSAVFDHLYLF